MRNPFAKKRVKVMTTEQAVVHVMYHRKLTRYGVAKAIGANPTSVYQWLKRTKMSKAYAEKFLQVFDIEVSDAV